MQVWVPEGKCELLLKWKPNLRSSSFQVYKERMDSEISIDHQLDQSYELCGLEIRPL